MTVGNSAACPQGLRFRDYSHDASQTPGLKSRPTQLSFSRSPATAVVLQSCTSDFDAKHPKREITSVTMATR